MFIDTHCHLNFHDYSTDLPSVLSRARRAGVRRCIVPGVDYHTSVLSIELAATYKTVLYPSIGFHPYEADNEPDVEMLRPLLLQGVVAIGECGLDYHQYKGEQALGKKDKQKRLFESHLKLALSANLPVIIHCREAFDDLFSILDSLPEMPHGVIHCFSGGNVDSKEAQRRHLYLGIDGNCTYSKQIQYILPNIPLSSLLIETDSPNLTPLPFRGKRNEPYHIKRIATYIASLIQTPVEIIEQQTFSNACTLFHLS